MEGRGALWASAGEECAPSAATAQAAKAAASRGTNRPSSAKGTQLGHAAGATGARVECLAMQSPCAEEMSQSSVAWQTVSSSLSPFMPLSVDAIPPFSSASGTKAPRDDTPSALRAMAVMDSVNVPAAADSGAGERAAATGTRQGECWRPLAVSPPFLAVDFCQLPPDRPPLLTALGATAEVAASTVACLGKPLPQLTCRLRWAEAPLPRPATASETAPRASSAELDLPSWASLGAVIREYERVSRGAATAGGTPDSAKDSVGGTTRSHIPSWPLTVLWNTIPSYLAAKKDTLRERRAPDIAAASQKWCAEGVPPKGHAMETLTVCSVVVRGAAAILSTNEVNGVPGRYYGPPTSISVTGGCDGVVGEKGAITVSEDGRGALFMQYSMSFHAVLTRDTASSLLFTVHGVASPEEVLGFAVWAPFDTAVAAHVQEPQHPHRAGGVTDVWLPLFAPVSTDAVARATLSAQLPAVARPNRDNGQTHSTSGLLLVGWLHCDVEALFLSSMTEETAQQLWNGPQHSLSSLAAAPVEEAEHDECCAGRGIRVDDDTLVDFSVVEGAGLRPLTAHFGLPPSPTPLRWDDPASWGNETTCACVYCEVLAVRQEETSRQAPQSAPHAPGAFVAASSLLTAEAARCRPPTSDHCQSATASCGFDFVGFAAASYSQGRTVRSAPLSDSAEACGKGGAWAGADAVLPVTASAARTSHPRWQHKFRLGLASLSTLHLRVFDLCQHSSDSGDGEARPLAAEGGPMRACRGEASGRRAVLLGTATLTSWLLRRLLGRRLGEGCAWLPLLWSPRMAAGTTTASAAPDGKGIFEHHFLSAVCNGFLLVKWRRLPPATAVARLPCCGDLSSWCASVTRRLFGINGRHTARSEMRPRSSLWRGKELHEFPQSWYQPVASHGAEPGSITAAPTTYTPHLGWMSPEVVPWLRMDKVRLQWPWLQHLLCMNGGQVRLSLWYPTAQGETRLLAECRLVPLCALEEPSIRATGRGRLTRVHSRGTGDTAAVYGIVLSIPPSRGAAPPTESAAPVEATLYLPASPVVEVQVWWYPRDGAGAARGGCADAPSRFIGRGKWRFPAEDVAAEVRGLPARIERGACDEARSGLLSTMGASGLAGLSGQEGEGSATRPAPLPTSLRSFFTLHEADVRVAPVYNAGLPQHVEGGVLTWRLMSFPRLVCDDWGKVPPAMLPSPPASLSCVAGPCVGLSGPLRTPPGLGPASTWVMPDAGTPARVRVEVCNLMCFDHVDGPGIGAAQAAEALQIAVSGSSCNDSPAWASSAESAAIDDSRCWMHPGEAPPPDAFRAAYAFSPVCAAAANGAEKRSNTGGDESSAERHAVPDADASRFPTLEVQWPPRRFGWIDNAPPSLCVWVMAPSPFSGAIGAAGETDTVAAEGRECEWGAVRLPRLDAFTSTLGTLWLPLFRSCAAPALDAEVPRCLPAAESVVTGSGSSSSSSGARFRADSPPPQPSTAERVHCGVTVTAPPQSAQPDGNAAHPLMVRSAPCAAVVMKHVGFAAIRYAHNLQRRVEVEASPSGVKRSAPASRVLLARVGPLHRGLPLNASARGYFRSSSAPSPSGSHTSVLEVLPTPPSGAVQRALAASANTAGAASAMDAVLIDANGGTEVLLGVEAHQLSMRVPDADTDQDVPRQASSDGRVAVFPLPQRSCGDDGSHQMRLQARIGPSAAMATSTMDFDLNDGGEAAEGAQWVPLVVRRRLHDAHDVGYDGEGECVMAEILVQWRVVDLSAAAAPSRSTFSPLPLQRLVREYGGGSSASCSYTALSTLSASPPLYQSPSRQGSANVEQRACWSKLSVDRPKGQGAITAELASRALSRVLRRIEPRRHRYVYLRLDQLLLHCSARQRLAWAALQRRTTASPPEVRADGGHGGDVSTPLRLRLEVQLRWPGEWSALWCRPASQSPHRVLLGSETGAAASLAPAAVASATATAGVVSFNVWVDSAEGVFVGSSASATTGAAMGDEAATSASEECFLSCASLPPLCLALPSPQDIEHALGKPGLEARFSLTFALFAVLHLHGDDDSAVEKASEVCVGTGRAPLKLPRSAQFGLTSLLPPVDTTAEGGTAAWAGAKDAYAKDNVATMPALLRWRARVAQSLPVFPPVASKSRLPPKPRHLAPDNGMGVGDEDSDRDGICSSHSTVPSSARSFTEREEAIEGGVRTPATGPTAVPVLTRVTVTRMELCGVDVSLARGLAQRHHHVLPPATVTVMVTDATGATAAPTDVRGGTITAASTVHQLLPRLLLVRPTAASPPVAAASPASPPMTHPPPPQQQRYMWSTDVCLAASTSKLLFNVNISESALRSARADETRLQSRDSSAAAKPLDADAPTVDACRRWQHPDEVNVCGRAAYTLDLSVQVGGVRPPGSDGRLVSAARAADGTHDVVLQVESLVHGRWLGRLWIQVDVTAADLLMCDAASIFLTSRMTLSVQSCSGFAVGDVLLTCRAEETYARLRERAALLWKQRGKVPRRLRQQMKEIRQIRRQLRQGKEQLRDGAPADPPTLSTVGVVRVASAWGEDGTNSVPISSSKSFALPTATELVRQGCAATMRSASERAPLLSISRNIHTLPIAESATATMRLELCEASSGVAVAAGQMVLPLRSARTPWHDGAWQPPVWTATSPLSMRVALQPCAISEMRTRCIYPVTPSGGVADVTAAWSVHPARGDTWLTCFYVKPTAGGDDAAMPCGLLLLRWVYCFEATAYPETEHTVDMPVRSRLSMATSDRDGRDAQMPHAGDRLRDGVPVYWSGVAMQLPRIGPVGATLKRIELLEVTPISNADFHVGVAEKATAQPSPLERTLLPTRHACVTTQIAVHEWSAADEYCFEARRRQAQDSGEDSLVWLICEGASAASGLRCRGGWEVLLSLSTSNALAKCAATLLGQRKARTAGREEEHVAGPEPVSPRSRWYPRVDAKVLATRGAVPSAAGSDGGVVMRSLTFQCSGAAIAASGLGQVDTMTCRVVALRCRGGGDGALRPFQPPRREAVRGAVDYAEASIAVLNAGRVSPSLQEPRLTEDLPRTATASPTVAPRRSPPLFPAQLTATWSPTLGPSHSTVVAPCAVAVDSRADAHPSMQGAPPQTREGALLRVVLPLVPPDPVLEAVGDGGAGDVGRDGGGGVTTVLEEQFLIEVSVHGRRCSAGAEEVATTACYVSAPFCASDILRSARSCGERSGISGGADAPASVAGRGSQLYMTPSHWSSMLAMRLVSAPVGDGTMDSAVLEEAEKVQEAGPLPPQAPPKALMEVRWALDVLGVLPVRASAAGVVLASSECSRGHAHRAADHWAECTEADFGSLTRITDVTDDDDDVEGGGMSMRQLEACSAWADFLEAQNGMRDMQAAQAKLRHWRCTIVGVEVSGVELPSWCSMGAGTDAGTEDGVHDAAQCTPLLAQLVLPIREPSSAAGADAGRQPKQDSDSTGRYRRRRLRSKGEVVIGVARTTPTRVDRGVHLDTGSATSSRDGATAQGGARAARSVAPAWIDRSRSRGHWYTATFAPLSWSMAVEDMIAQAATAEHVAKSEATAAAVGRAPGAGLTVWQLLARAPAPSPSVKSSVGDSHRTTQDTTQLVYNLGSTQLARLLHEGALYLVQMLARWCGGVYTTKERDALLEMAALYPTQWMPLAPTAPITNDIQSEARVRFKCAYSYHGPIRQPPKSFATVLPPHSTAPRAFADTVLCLQLDHVQLIYACLDGAGAVAATAESHCSSAASVSAAWLRRLTLVIRVLVTTESAVNDTVVDSRCVAQWHTRLAPVPCGGAPPIMEPAPAEDRVAPFAPAAASTTTLQTAPALSLPFSVAVPMPDPVPVPVTDEPSSGGGASVSAELPQQRGDEDHKRVAAAALRAPPSAINVVPMLPATSLCYWQPSSAAENADGSCTAQTFVTVPAARATQTTTITSVEAVLLLLPDEKAEKVNNGAAVSFQGRLHRGGSSAVAGTVIGRTQVRVGCSSLSDAIWDVAGKRVGSGWRLSAPLSMQLPVTAEAGLPRSGHDVSASAASSGGGREGKPQPSWTLLFGLYIFTAPSMAQVAALQVVQAAQAEQRRCSLADLQRTEEALVASVTASYHLHEGAGEANTDAGVATAGQRHARRSQLSHKWMSRVPYQLLRAPPTVIRVDTFAVWGAVPSTSERRTGEDGAAQLFQMLWTVPQRPMMQRVGTHAVAGGVSCPSRGCSEGADIDDTSYAALPAHRQAWLVDELNGEVRAPVWTRLSSGPPVLQKGCAAGRTPSHAPSLASHLHSGRAILRDAQRLKLDWRSVAEGNGQQSARLLAALAGLVGGAPVAYTAADGSACLWVSGGLRRPCAEGLRYGTQQSSMLQGSDKGDHAGRRATKPAPPLFRFPAQHRGASRRRGQQLLPPHAVMVTSKNSSRLPSPGLNPRAASCPLDYDLYVSHFLRWTVVAHNEHASTPGSRCEVHTPVAWSLSAPSSSTSALPRLFHSATLVGGRIWLLGGWAAPAGVEDLPSTPAALVGTAGLVERRRREVRQAVIHSRDTDATGDRRSPVSLEECSSGCIRTSASDAQCDASRALPSAPLIWCEEVHCVRCLDDGFPAPSVRVSLPSLQGEDCADTTGTTSCWLATPPRLACHVAVACEDRCVVLFGGLMVPTGADDDEPVATSTVHIYDTVQGRWSAQSESNTGDAQGEWPMARYGHCAAPVPGTDGVRQPRSYFVFGGATTTASCRTLLVPPAQLLWIWTPVLAVTHRGSRGSCEVMSVHSTWQRVQLPVGLATPFSGRFLPQLHAYSAVEVTAAVRGSAETLEDGSAAPSDPGPTSMVLCVAGGLTAPALAQHTVPDIARDRALDTMEATSSDAYRTFSECVEPWFAHPARDVASVLLRCDCELQQLLPPR
ncbi:hypothetical protein LSCM1_05315 [Leishmania martiniquensis]|uniref:C2 domain-containing protein n=1 Tax=Leishmania martiniquensis TaxID=1580590 RepID=A0A836HFQ5_9TRYP|nr:hypothetical protein LSCM1_05315 [Leishmania martiniquensis]